MGCYEDLVQKGRGSLHYIFITRKTVKQRSSFQWKYDLQMKIVDAHICVTANIPPCPFKLPECFIEIKVNKDGTSTWFDWTGQNLVPPEMSAIDPSTAMKRKRDWQEEQELTKQLKLNEQRLKRAKLKKNLSHLHSEGYL
jgi:hypothetical protein